MLSSDHDIAAAKGSIRQADNGGPRLIVEPFHYPLDAVCLCGKPIRIDRNSILDVWYYIDADVRQDGP